MERSLVRGRVPGWVRMRVLLWLVPFTLLVPLALLSCGKRVSEDLGEGADSATSGQVDSGAVDQGTWTHVKELGDAGCLTPLPANGSGCVVLVTLTNGTDLSDPVAACTSGSYPGFTAPAGPVLAELQSIEQQAWQAGGDIGPNPASLPTCQVNHLTGSALVNGSCVKSIQPGWCYAPPPAPSTCAEAILFSPGTLPTGSQVYVQCNGPSGG
ncbi:MAG: hypothetical protein ACLQVI_21240 [Polyangiaceae bacterium]